jgi:ribosomal protein L18
MRKDLRIQVFSSCDGHSVQVINTDENKVVHHSSWDHNNAELGAGGEVNFVRLLEWLGYDVYHEEVY